MLLDHSLTYAVARGLPGVLNFLAIAVYTRLLAPEAYGEYSLVLAGVGLLDSLLIQWLRLGLLRFLPGLRDKPDELLTTLRSVWFLLAGGVTLLVLLCLPFGLLPPALLLGGLLLFICQGWFELNLELVRTRLQPRRYGRLALLRAFLSLGLGALFAWLWSAPGLLYGLSLGSALSYLLLGGGSGWPKSWSRPDPVLLQRLLGYGLPLTITFALGFIVSSSDRFLLGWLEGTDAAGLYSAGYDLAQFSITMLLTIVNLAAYPLTVRALEESGETAAREQLHSTLQLLLTVGLPATVGLAMLAGPVAHVVVAPAFAVAASGIIPWIALSALLAGIKAFFVDVGFQLGGDTRLQAWVMLLAAVLNVVLNLLFIPRFGLLGAVYATVIVYALCLLVSLWLVRSSFRLPAPRPVLLAPLVATGGMALVLRLLGQPVGLWQLLLWIGIGALAYGLLLAFLMPGLRRRFLRM